MMRYDELTKKILTRDQFSSGLDWDLGDGRVAQDMLDHDQALRDLVEVLISRDDSVAGIDAQSSVCRGGPSGVFFSGSSDSGMWICNTCGKAAPDCEWLRAKQESRNSKV